MACWWHVWELILGLFCSATPTLTWHEGYKSRNIKGGKVVSVHTRKAYVACTGIAPVTLYLITIWMSIATLIPLLLYPWGKNWRLGGSQTFWREVTSASCWDSNAPDHPTCGLLTILNMLFQLLKWTNECKQVNSLQNLPSMLETMVCSVHWSNSWQTIFINLLIKHIHICLRFQSEL